MLFQISIDLKWKQCFWLAYRNSEKQYLVSWVGWTDACRNSRNSLFPAQYAVETYVCYAYLSPIYLLTVGVDHGPATGPRELGAR